MQGVIIYLLIYMAMTLGTFACILAMRRGETMVEDIDDLAGLSRTNPMMAFMLAMLLFSLAGIPPLAGFFAKFYVFLAAIESGLYVLAVIGVLASVVGAYYYLRIVKIMYFDEPAGGFAPMADGTQGRPRCQRCLHPVLHLHRRTDRHGRGLGCQDVLLEVDGRPATRRLSPRAPRQPGIHQCPCALAAARAGAAGGLWVTAGEQTAGRGRRGRAWTTGAGNLAASLMLIDPAPRAVAATLSFVAAVALHQAVVDVAGPGRRGASGAQMAERSAPRPH